VLYLQVTNQIVTVINHIKSIKYADELEINILESIVARKIVVFILEDNDNNSFNLLKYNHYQEEIDYSTGLCVLYHGQVKEHYSCLLMQK
jgi:hypothetical protein